MSFSPFCGLGFGSSRMVKRTKDKFIFLIEDGFCMNVKLELGVLNL
jgi:hypothetical protein